MAEPGPPVSEHPEAEQPARPLRDAPPRPGASPGGPARPAPRGGPFSPAPVAGAAAQPAAVAAGAGPSGAVAERLARAVTAPSGGGRDQSEKLVYVWPHLVTIEFISALLMLLSMVVLSWIVNAPLEAHANPDRTPNPSKAPWYFLNLQELLLHMHPALAGVLVPSGALTLIAMIPYFDRDTSDLGRWFGVPNAKPIAIFTTVYTVIVEVTLIFFDQYIGVKPLMTQLADATGIDYLKDVTPGGVALFSMPNVIVPTLLMLGPIAPLMFIIVRRYKPNTRGVMIVLFTGFVVSYVVLTVFGTFFRGHGMNLCWLTDPCQIRLD